MRHVPVRFLRAAFSRPCTPPGQGSGGTLTRACSPPLLRVTASCRCVPQPHMCLLPNTSSLTLESPAFGQAQLQAQRRSTLTGRSTISRRVAGLHRSSSSRSCPCQILTASYHFQMLGLPILWAFTSCWCKARWPPRVLYAPTATGILLAALLACHGKRMFACQNQR